MANLLLFANNAASSLLGAVGPTDTVISVPNSEGARFPSPATGYSFMLTLEDASGNVEIVECTGRTADVLTVVRGRDGTAAKSFTAGAAVEARVTAGMLSYLDWRVGKNTAGNPLVLDIDGKAPIATFDTPLQTYGDNRWQGKLGYTPVEQGGGTGQLGNKLRIGWDGSNVLVQVDSTVFQAVMRTAAGTAMALTNARFKAVSSPSEDDLFFGPLGWYVYGSGATAIGLYHPTKGVGFTFDDASRVFNVGGAITSNNTAVSLNGHTHSISAITSLSDALNSKLGTGGGTITGNLTVTGTVVAGAVTAATITDTSDERYKSSITDMTVDDAIAIVTGTRARRFFNKTTNNWDFGVIAQEQLLVTSELVPLGSDGMYSVAYQRLVAPLSVAVQNLLTRVAVLEAKNGSANG